MHQKLLQKVVEEEAAPFRMSSFHLNFNASAALLLLLLLVHEIVFYLHKQLVLVFFLLGVLVDLEKE